MSKTIKLGIVGAGGFSSHFGEIFLNHPMVEGLAVADLDRKRANAFAEQVECAFGVYDSLESLCKSNVDAVALFTPRHTHTEHTIVAMNAGKHVYSAVPAIFSLNDAESLVAKVEETGLIYMAGETSYYYPSVIYCRERFRKGEFGQFIYGEAQYTHDMETWGPHFKLSFGDEWKRQAGMPPMYYPSHSISMLLSVTGARATRVSGFGFEDNNPDNIYGYGSGRSGNPFSNEFALIHTSDGGCMRITEARRIGLFNHGKEVCLNMFYGTDACYEENSIRACFGKRDGRSLEDLTALIDCPYFPEKDELFFELNEKTIEIDGYRGVSRIHPIERLPKEFRGLRNGHNGSHQFLVDDFVKSCVYNVVPPNDVWSSVRYCVPGLVAHESALRGGELMDVPDFGECPQGVRRLEDVLSEGGTAVK